MSDETEDASSDEAEEGEAGEPEDPRSQSVQKLLQGRMKDSRSIAKLSTQLLKGADGGLEIGSLRDWLDRLNFQLVWLEKDDYSKALVRALWLAQVFAPTDFGGTRQRDMGQVWTDTARGFLGEIAFSRFLAHNFGVETRIDTSRGDLKKYLSTDVAEVREPGKSWRRTKVKVSIKTTKFNGRWLDVGSQFDHSDIFVLVKIGVLRPHFITFLKSISFLRDKLFVEAKNLGELSGSDADKLWDEIPEFEPMPAYVTGFLDKSKVSLPIQEMDARLVGRKSKKVVISHGVGLFNRDTVRASKLGRELDPDGNLPIKIDPIIQSLTNVHFLAHSGALEFARDSWGRLVAEL